MGAINLAATMDALAEALIQGNVTSRAYAWPVESVNAPCAVVGYPTEPIDFSVTFQRGSDRVIIPIYFLVGRTSDRTARNQISEIVGGSADIVNAIDGDLGGLVQTATVLDCDIQTMTIAATDYIAAVFRIEIYA